MMFKYTNYLIVTATMLLTIGGCKQTNEKTDPLVIVNDANYFNGLTQYRKQVNAYFIGESSPLDDSLISKFEGVQYYPIDTNFRVLAKFESIRNGNVFKFLTTGDIADTYQTIGKLHFTINKVECVLEVYENQDLKNEGTQIYFIPFWDKTNGSATYAGGRYIDMEPFESETIILDFNTAYQPYCFYNQAYSCPVPPAVNKLSVAIAAGEKM